MFDLNESFKLESIDSCFQSELSEEMSEEKSIFSNVIKYLINAKNIPWSICEEILQKATEDRDLRVKGYIENFSVYVEVMDKYDGFYTKSLEAVVKDLDILYGCCDKYTEKFFSWKNKI